MRARRRVFVAVGALALAGCTDAATRIGYDIEAGAKSLQSSAQSGATMRHEQLEKRAGAIALVEIR